MKKVSVYLYWNEKLESLQNYQERLKIFSNIFLF